MRIYANDIWMLSLPTLRNLTRGVLHELHNRIIDNPQGPERAVDLKQFEDACNTSNRSYQALNRRMG
jgi:hypothetical protein